MKSVIVQATGVALLTVGLTPLARAQAVPPRLSAAEHQQAVTAFQQKLDAEYRNPVESPLPAEARAGFQGLPYFPIDYGYYVEARLVRDSTSAPFRMKTSIPREAMYRKYGELHFTLQGQALKLTVYESLALKTKPGYEDYLFLPFTDPTNGKTSYGGGRYLDLRITKANTIWLDFNQAYNPYCAYSKLYSCPIPPRENHLPVAISAGVRSE